MPLITFETTPSGAAAFLEDRLIGTTPVQATVPSGEIEVVFWKKGYEIQRYKTTVNGDGKVGANLSEDPDVPAPDIPSSADPKTQQLQPATSRGMSTAGKIILGVLAIGGAGAGAWWLWRRHKRNRGSSFHGTRRKPLDAGGATRIRGLGSSEVTCDARQAGSKYGVRTCITRPKEPGPVVTSPTAVCKLLAPAKDADRESFFTISLNARGNVIGVEETAKGDVSGVNVHPREVFKSPLLLGASMVVVAHNHPSGDPVPSAEDKELTKRLIRAGRLVGVPLVDHIVVGKTCDSLAERWPDMFSPSKTGEDD